MIDLNWFTFSAAHMARLARAIAAVDAPLLLECATSAYSMWVGGNQWSSGVDFLSFFRHVAKLPLDYSKWQHYEAAAIHAGPRIMHADFCMISDRPERLLVDSQGRPHCDDGPFCRWRDGSALYAVHGVRVPGWIVERPAHITAEKIEAEANAEIRRIMIDRYGLARYLRDSGAKPIDHEEGIGTLLRKEEPGDDPIYMVEVVNTTPEADGSFKRYMLDVSGAGERSPGLIDDRPGMKGRMTARAAVAATFGMKASQYRPAVET